MAKSAGFDSSKLKKFEMDLIRMAQDQFPQETKKFLRSEGTKLRRMLREQTKSKAKKKTGNLLKGIDKGPVYKHGDEWSQRVYNKAPHAHLIEHGHVVWSHGKETEYYAEGKHPAALATQEMKSIYPEDVDGFIDDLLGKGLGR